MTIVKLARLRGPGSLADYYRLGASWMLEVAQSIGSDVSEQRTVVAQSHSAMLNGIVDVNPTKSRSITSILKGDAFWYGPYTQWLPPGWKRGLKALSRPIKVNLNSTADLYADNLDAFNAPTFSTPDRVTVNGQQATSYVSGFNERFVLGAALLHTEWFFDVIDDHDIDAPDGLETQVLHESKMYFTGQSDTLSPQVRRFQRKAFEEDTRWMRGVDNTYNMNSRIFDRASRLTEQVANEL